MISKIWGFSLSLCPQYTAGGICLQGLENKLTKRCYNLQFVTCKYTQLPVANQWSSTKSNTICVHWHSMDFHNTNLRIKKKRFCNKRVWDIFISKSVNLKKVHIYQNTPSTSILQTINCKIQLVQSRTYGFRVHKMYTSWYCYTCPRPREEKFDPPKIGEYPDKWRPPSAVIWNLIEDLGIYRTFLSANGRQASVGNDGT